MRDLFIRTLKIEPDLKTITWISLLKFLYFRILDLVENIIIIIISFGTIVT